MAATAGTIGKGTTLGYTTVGGSSYTTIAEVRGVNDPGWSMEMVDFTNYTSPNSTIEKLPSGWYEPGETEVDITYVTAARTALEAIYGVLKDWKITLPDTHTITFTGVINKNGHEIPYKDRQMQKITITATTKPTYT